MPLNEAIIDVKEKKARSKALKWFSSFFEKLQLLLKATPNSMPYFAIIAFNTYSKKFTNTLLTVFKSSDETVPVITCNSGVVNI